MHPKRDEQYLLYEVEDGICEAGGKVFGVRGGLDLRSGGCGCKLLPSLSFDNLDSSLRQRTSLMAMRAAALFLALAGSSTYAFRPVKHVIAPLQSKLRVPLTQAPFRSLKSEVCMMAEGGATSITSPKPEGKNDISPKTWKKILPLGFMFFW